MKDARLGDSMPPRKDVKWGAMTPSDQRMSSEWESMHPSDAHMSEKWVEQHPSKARMSEKWVDMENPSEGDKWDVLKQDSRSDPYQLQPGRGDDTKIPFKAMAKQRADGGKVSRATQHDEHGSTREI